MPRRNRQKKQQRKQRPRGAAAKNLSPNAQPDLQLAKLASPSLPMIAPTVLKDSITFEWVGRRDVTFASGFSTNRYMMVHDLVDTDMTDCQVSSLDAFSGAGYWNNVIYPARTYYTYYTIDRVTVRFIPSLQHTSSAHNSYRQNQMLVAFERTAPEAQQDFLEFSNHRQFDCNKEYSYSWSPAQYARSRAVDPLKPTGQLNTVSTSGYIDAPYYVYMLFMRPWGNIAPGSSTLTGAVYVKYTLSYHGRTAS